MENAEKVKKIKKNAFFPLFFVCFACKYTNLVYFINVNRNNGHNQTKQTNKPKEQKMEIIIDNTNAYTKSVEKNINVVENTTWEKVIKEIVQKIISKKDKLIHVKKILEAKFDIIGELVIVTATAKTELLNHRYFEVAFQLDKNLVWNCNENQQYVRMFGYKEF